MLVTKEDILKEDILENVGNQRRFWKMLLTKDIWKEDISGNQRYFERRYSEECW